ncbi:olfactory receptor 5AP2-like [Ambystoma mexicanum]|uniref:olfactory receptor 5AP2-like n=1 Tax=Ambystoma mexicanum TaxID=8296 RepID=UPI0037E8B3FB
MKITNQTLVTEFILVGLTDDPALQVLLFVLFLIVYMITLLGNVGIVLVIRISPLLHTPMYFFLSYLSFTDVCYSSAITPNMLVNFLREKKSISLMGCAAQMYFFASLATIENLLLAVMAYDRYVAICHPLLYSTIMRNRFCLQLVILVYICGYSTALIHTVFTLRLTFCGSNVINHFYCDVPPVLSLACVNAYQSKAVIFALAVLLGTSSLSVTLMSYIYIICTILKIRSAQGRRKAFSTCASHLTVVALFYVTVLFIYLRPPSSYSETQNKVVSVFYTVVIPMLNPIIYSLRNREVKEALRKVIHCPGSGSKGDGRALAN